MEKATFKDAARAQLSVLAPLEKKCLLWLANHMPARVNSDHLTLLGFLGMMMAGFSYGLARWYPKALLLGIVALAVNWFGDSLDGTLARVRNKLRPRYGFYVDHVVDLFGQFFLLGGLALSGYMHPGIALGVLIAFYMLSIEVYLATYTIGTFHLSFFKLGPTEARIFLAIGNLYVLYHPMVTLWGQRLRLFDVGGICAILGMGFFLILSSIKHTLKLYRAERIP